MLKQRIKNKTQFISAKLYIGQESQDVLRKTQKNKNKLALLQSMSNRKNSDKLKK